MTRKILPLHKGDRVRVYQRPLTKDDFEGNATLIEEYRPDDGDGVSMWEVRFDGEQSTWLRTVNAEDKLGEMK